MRGNGRCLRAFAAICGCASSHMNSYLRLSHQSDEAPCSARGLSSAAVLFSARRRGGPRRAGHRGSRAQPWASNSRRGSMESRPCASSAGAARRTAPDPCPTVAASAALPPRFQTSFLDAAGHPKELVQTA